MSQPSHISMPYLVAYALRQVYWDNTVANEPPTIDYNSVMGSEEAVGRWTSLIVGGFRDFLTVKADPSSVNGVSAS